MKYVDKDGDGYTNLLYFEDETQLMARTRGDWGTFRFPIEFYGNEHKIDFFVLQRGRGVLFGYGDEVTRAGHFQFENAQYKQLFPDLSIQIAKSA